MRALCVVACMLLFVAGAWPQLLPAAALEPTGGMAPPAGQVTQNFDAGQPEGWELPPSARIAQAGRGRALVFSGPGHVFWPDVHAKDLSLRLRYLHAQGTGEVVLRVAGEPPQDTRYHVRFTPDGVEMLRGVGESEQILATAPGRLPTGQWYDVTIQALGGNLRVTLNGRQVLQAVDPQPLPMGGVAFGCMDGEGIAYDDVSLASTTSPVMDPSGGRGATPINLPRPATGPAINPAAGRAATPINLPTPVATSNMQHVILPPGGGGGGGTMADTMLPPGSGGPVPAAAYVIVLKIDGIDGDCKLMGYQKWINVGGYTYKIDPMGTARSSTGARDAANPEILRVFKEVDVATPLLASAAFTKRKPPRDAELAICEVYGSAMSPVMTVELKDISVTSVTAHGLDPYGRLTEEVGLSAASIKWKVYVTDQTGKTAGSVEAGWNLKGNRPLP